MNKVTVESITIEKVDSLVTSRIEYLKELQPERASLESSLLESSLREYFKKKIANGEAIAVMALEEGVDGAPTPVSFGAIILKKIPGDLYCSEYLEGDVLNMYTIPRARHKGYSQIILGALIEKAKEAGVNKLSLHTTEAGEKLYRKFGFANPLYPVLELNLL